MRVERVHLPSSDVHDAVVNWITAAVANIRGERGDSGERKRKNQKRRAAPDETRIGRNRYNHLLRFSVHQVAIIKWLR